MKPFELLDVKLDVEALQREVLACDRFDEIHYRRTSPNSPHYEMTDLWVRYNDIKNFAPLGDGKSTFNDEHDSVWYSVSEELPSIKKVCFDLMRSVDGERLGGILVTKLPPKGKIHRHVDSGWHAAYYDKFYIPITTPKGSFFGFDGGDIHSELGQAWWFDNSIPHWVENDTDEERISMIVCIRTEKFKGKNARRI